MVDFAVFETAHNNDVWKSGPCRDSRSATPFPLLFCNQQVFGEQDLGEDRENKQFQVVPTDCLIFNEVSFSAVDFGLGSYIGKTQTRVSTHLWYQRRRNRRF